MKHPIAYIFFYCLTLAPLIFWSFLNARSVHRASCLPELTTRWVDGQKTYKLRHNNLEPNTIFAQYNEHYLMQHTLPATIAPRYNPEEKVQGAVLQNLLEDVVKQLQSTRKYQLHFKDFVILKRRDYNPRTNCGLIVVKFKNYPFVAKIFMESPQSFVAPFSKGFEPCCFFVMSGGINRYLLGFGRIQNREAIQQLIDADPYWKDKVSTPRKWFWKPKNSPYFEITSKNLGTSNRRVVLPSVYAIVCDAIEADPFCITNSENRKMGIQLSHFFGSRIDSHIDNFLIERSTGKFIVIDTEHFATQVGLRNPLTFDSYSHWYWQLAKKCIGNCFFRTKKEHLFFQKTPPPLTAD